MNPARPLRPLLSLLVFLLAVPAQAGGVVDRYPAAKAFFPGADRFGDFEGKPPAAPVYKGDKLLGYVFVTNDVVKIPAYSGKPVNLLMGLGLDGRITGIKVLEHHEPILLVGIPEQALFDFAAKYVGKSVTDRIKVGAGKREGYVNIDAITGATVTVIVVNRTIMRAAHKVAVARGVIKPSIEASLPPARVRMELYQPADWKYLTGNGSIRRLLLTRSEVEEAFKGTKAEGLLKEVMDARACEALPPGEACDAFLDMYYAYLNAPTIGRNLLGESQYNWLMSELKPGEHALAVMANGVYSFKGSGYVRGGIFDRIQVAQGDLAVNFHDLDYYRLSDVYAKGMPKFKEMAIFIIRKGYEFDPGRDWSLALLVRQQTGPLSSVYTTFNGHYDIPAAYVEKAEPPAPDQPMWVVIWGERGVQIGVLMAALAVLTVILLLQDWLVRFPGLLVRVRLGFLIFTTFFIGWYMLGQLSVVNVLAFTSALFHDFRWETFLVDPAIFILWTFVAGTLLLWGRGVYCGWLCPFGALQKLINEAARRLMVPQLNLPWIVNERLWAVKYIILLVLFGISLQEFSAAERYAEVEPFKTAITLHFAREWGYVLYAAILLLISAFNCKFYCKYLCPLGAALAIPAKLRLFDWLRRRRECGRPCQICNHECEIQAIHETGKINANECHYCLDCQVTYYDAFKCPPLAEKRKRRERAARARDSVRNMEHNPSVGDDRQSIPVEMGRQGGGRPESRHE